MSSNTEINEFLKEVNTFNSEIELIDRLIKDAYKLQENILVSPDTENSNCFKNV